jgi:hypothetical protein
MAVIDTREHQEWIDRAANYFRQRLAREKQAAPWGFAP